MRNSKYRPLFDYLHQRTEAEVTLTLAEIEALLGKKLPSSARSNRGWWSNRSQGTQAAAWREAGYVADSDLGQERVIFRKPKRIQNSGQRRAETGLWDGEMVKALRKHMKMNQTQFAEKLGMRQQTISEWETGVYAPSRTTSKHLDLVAEQAEFKHDATDE